MEKFDSGKGIFFHVNRVLEGSTQTRDDNVKFWFDMYFLNMEFKRYDIAYEYLAMNELCLVKLTSKNDPFRLTLWRMFVMDFRRAFSDYEFSNFYK